MRYYYPISVLTLLFGLTSAYGQVNLTDMSLASTDSIQRNKIRYFSPGKGGKDKVWDFSKKFGSKGASQVIFKKDSLGELSVIEPGKISYYRTTSNTLFLDGSESQLEKKEYVGGKFSKKFPLEYGDSISRNFRCEGMYCGDHPFREEGTTTVHVDADGSIVLAENDTVRNVRRVHTIDSYSICMDINYEALDTAQLTQIIDERYEWYIPDSQYPIFVDAASTTYYNMEAIGTTKYAFCNLPESMATDYIIPEDENETDEQDNSFDKEPQSPDIIHYKIDFQGKTIHMAYSLDEDATITTIVANHRGMLFSSRQCTQEAGQDYSIQIDCRGLRSGVYILYINVNGKIYSEKITI